MHDRALLALNAAACLALGLARVAGHAEVPFQAVAHVYVGGLFVYGYKRLRATDCLDEEFCFRRRQPCFWLLAWALSLVELFTALHQRGFF